ncbi:MAG: TetR family transcriptional regulator [Myxococcales bacterium]|nr:TetR family transcriptional regulator [Myxococcales bacterium]
MSSVVRRSQDERRETTRALLIESAVTLFALKGSHGTTLQDVAEAAGISKGAVTYHFTSKDSLVDAVFRRCAEGLVEKVYLAERDNTHDLAGFRALIAAVWRPFVAGAAEARVMADLATLGQYSEPLAHAVQAGLAVLSESLATALDRHAAQLKARFNGGAPALAELVIAAALGASLSGASPGDDTQLGPVGELMLGVALGRLAL